MYNPQLKSFIQTADAGSFNKAAEAMNITPTALIKQINLLEKKVGAELFMRSRRGLALTAAGKSFYADVKEIIQSCDAALMHVKEIVAQDSQTIRIGVSPLTPIHCLEKLWPKIRTLYPELKIQVIPFENKPDIARELLRSFGKNIDVIMGIFDDQQLMLWECAGMEISRVPLQCAVSVHHRLASKERLRISDLYGENMLMIFRGWNTHMDELRDEILSHHSRIQLHDFDFYDVEVFNRCQISNDVLPVIDGWAKVHPLIKVIPVEWEHCVPFGFMYSPTPSDVVLKFLQTVNKALKQN